MMHFAGATAALYVISLAIPAVQSLQLNVNDAASIKNAAATVAYDMMSYYTGNLTSNKQNVGLLPAPYYWWEAGALWGAMIQYWQYTGDTSYNKVVDEAIRSQASPTNDFMMLNLRNQLGNDDQAFWALTAMSAAEYGFPNPSKPSWIELATNVFNNMVDRWGLATCGGGLKWQFFSSNAGYDYKSSITNGAFFQLAARLARYTGNTTYSDWADKTWNWMTDVNLISPNYNVYDGTDDTINCSRFDGHEWSYNNGALLYGSAMLANLTAPTTPWANRTRGLLQASKTLFFSPYPNSTDVMFELWCEKTNTCNNDQYSFKAYLARWLYATAKVMPELESDIQALMRPTALAAARSCSGGPKGRTCGATWWYPGWDGTVGLGQEMSALEAIHGLLLDASGAPGVLHPKT